MVIRVKGHGFQFLMILDSVHHFQTTLYASSQVRLVANPMIKEVRGQSYNNP